MTPSMKDRSREKWNGEATVDHINCGSRQRLADAAERIASSLELIAGVLRCPNAAAAARAIVRADKRLAKKFPIS